MDFQSLFLQINELEEANRRERSRYEEEVALHNSTKMDLERVQRSALEFREENDKLKVRVMELTTTLQNSELLNTQFKQELKLSKEENLRIIDSTQTEKAITIKQRESYMQALDAVNLRVRSMKEKHHLDLKAFADEVKDIRSRCRCSQLKTPQPPTVLEVVDSSVDLAAQNTLVAQAKELQSQLEELRRKDAEQQAALNKSASDFKMLTEEFHQLDQYSNQLQEYCSKVQQEIQER